MAKKYSEASFLSTNSIEHPVKGKKENFYPVSVGMAFRLKTLAEPLGLALASIFKTDTKNDAGRKEIISPVDGDRVAQQTTIEPISMQLAQFRAAQTSGAVVDFVKALAGEDTQKMLADLVMDSMRDYEKIPAEDFLRLTPIGDGTFGEQLAGVVAANKGVFGPLVQKLSTAFGDVKNKVVENLVSKMRAGVAAASAKVEDVPPPPLKMPVTDLTPEPSPNPVPSAT